MLAEAATAAGLDVVAVVPDAVAVAAAGPADGDVLVIDVGSALTVSVVDTAGDPPQILWSGISTGAGGEAIAHAIRAVTDVPVDRARQLARGAPPETREIPLDWTAIRAQAEAGVTAARELINDVLRRADRDGAAIWRVYITGGASVAPFLSEAAGNRFGADKVHEFAGPAAERGLRRAAALSPGARRRGRQLLAGPRDATGRSAPSRTSPTPPRRRRWRPNRPRRAPARSPSSTRGPARRPRRGREPVVDDQPADWTPAAPAAPTSAREAPVPPPRRRLRRFLVAILVVAIAIGVVVLMIVNRDLFGLSAPAPPPAVTVAASSPPGT